MSLTALILVLISTLTHATWNLIGKREHPSLGFFLVANFFGTLCLLPAFILYGGAIASFPPHVWWIIALTGFFEAVYYAGLAGAYRHGDMSVAYPLARSSAVIFVTIITAAVPASWAMSGEPISAWGLIGIGLIVVGCFTVPLKHFSDLGPHHWLKLSCLLALVAAIGTTGYTLCDRSMLVILREAMSPQLNVVQGTLLYAFLWGTSANIWLALFVLSRKRGREGFRNVIRGSLSRALPAGLAIYVGYALVLIALNPDFVDNASYIVAFRQISIPLGSVLGVIILKEHPHVPKFVGVAIMLIGLILLKMG